MGTTEIPDDLLPTHDLAAELATLAHLIDQLQPPARTPLQTQFARVLEAIGHQSRVLANLTPGLQDLRVELTYMDFDMQATRAELAELRAQRDRDYESETD